MTRTLRLSRQARRDIEALLAWSRERFGEEAANAYEHLIETGFDDLLAEPNRLGSVSRPEFGDGFRAWHLRLSRERASPRSRVNRPRHFIIYRIESHARVGIVRVLHDAMDLERHLVARDD